MPRLPSRRRIGPWKPRTALLALVALAVIGGAAAMALPRDEGPRPVTVAEAQRLAMARFNTYDTGTMRVTVTLHDDSGTTTVRGLADYRAHRAVGRFTVDGAGRPDTGLIAWDAAGLAVSSAPARGADEVAGTTKAVARTSPRSWSPRAYTEDPLDNALRLVMALATDRPDNPQLLAQAGPRRLRDETLRGTAYTLFSGPRPRGSARDSESPLTYWVDEEGRLGRLEARIAPLPGPARVDLTAAPDGLRVPDRPWAAQAAAGTGRR
ncbi:hypothetical protein [Streptomyces formicae]|uniref:Uncharacterized protein n=1 Tax=Streptomyces formicae TaxID=1616117 RepID=A0A291Q129_9ACTN|nr:hypothetical protein [Streptomyces formicae]ATL25223.1 hypothetical protein KY5_0205c [Streptomyces formicae]